MIIDLKKLLIMTMNSTMNVHIIMYSGVLNVLLGYLSQIPIKNILQDLAKTFQDLASWQEICSKSMPTFRTCKNLSYLARFLFQIHAKILYCLISGQILARS